MSRFLQLHLLSFFPPANLNRDDTGRPKTAVVGGATRLRISSQALKRAWRTSEVFKAALNDHMGQRTQRLGEVIKAHLVERGVAEAEAVKVARQIVPLFGKPKPEKDPNPTRTEQLAFIAPEERAAALALAERIAAGEKITPKPEDVLRRADTAADIALFGRMLADNPDYNREAAAQVAHAITTHRVAVEDDYYTAVDDLKTPAEDAGAGFVGEAAFGSGVFYLYVSVNRELLERNLGGDKALAGTALAALAEAAATTAPRGKQNSFAAHGRAHYILAELGDRQPRTLAGAFARPVEGEDLMDASIRALEEFRDAMDAAYGQAYDSAAFLRVGTAGRLSDILAFCRGA
ncbi:MAG: type I-E CRISPR-associated protein Cas7/Cse4/CasC [Acetobacteraceae bacterium]|nr:type I-E CRISPR-associated protein Cas7/Cse4/CasC [Acetobacteraceae bacterium]